MGQQNRYGLTFSSIFDTTFENHRYSMYDHFPYVGNVDICNVDHICLVSGNLIKGYRCKTDTLEDKTTTKI